MTMRHDGMTRRRFLAASGAGVLTAGAWGPGLAQTKTLVRQGYQTNMWGMPTYYLLRSGQLEKQGIQGDEVVQVISDLADALLRLDRASELIEFAASGDHVNPFSVTHEDPERIIISNVAGEGAKMALLSVRERAGATALLEEVTYVELSDRADFNDRFVDQLGF